MSLNYCYTTDEYEDYIFHKIGDGLMNITSSKSLNKKKKDKIKEKIFPIEFLKILINNSIKLYMDKIDHKYDKRPRSNSI